MRVNLKLSLAMMLSAAFYGPAISFAQQDFFAPSTKAAVSSCSCQSSCSCGDKAAEDAPACDPWRVFPEICGWQLYGFINASVTANADGPQSRFNGPVTFLDREDARLNQAYAILEKVATSEDGCFAWGGRVDLLYGTDYVFTQAAGLELHQNGAQHWNGHGGVIPEEYGLAMPQIYGEVAVGDLSVKVGHFYTIMGYQVVAANGNFFPTQPYTFQYGEPFTHTGALATWKLDEELTIYGGLLNGWDKFDATTDKLAGLGGFMWAPESGDFSVFLTGIIGEEDGIAPILGTRALYSLVFTYNFTDKFQYVLQHDNGWQENGVGAGVDAEWYGLNQYLFYTVNECWKLGVRGEWFRDDDGVRLASAPVRLGGLGTGALAPVAPATLAGNYYEVAVGANWTPHANLIVRPEARFDWSDGTTGQPFDDRTKDSQFIAAVDAIILY